MPDMIKDGQGTGNLCGVSDNRLKTSACAQNRIYYESRDNASVFSFSAEVSDYGVGDTILLLKNISRIKTFVITQIVCSSSTTTPVILHSPACLIPTGTTVVGINVNRQSALVADAIAKADETTNTQESVILRAYMLANMALTIDPKAAVRLGLNNCIAIDFVMGGTMAYVTIGGFYEENTQ